jgi:putative membrane protein
MKIKEWFRKLIAGLAIGAGAAIPGVSGAAIAVIFRVYEDIIGAVNNFRKKFGWAIKVLIPILLGILVAVAVCIVLFSWAFEHVMFILICLFAGFLIGSFPGITDEVKGGKITTKAIILIAIGALFVIGLGTLSVIVGMNDFSVAQFFTTMPWWLYLVLIPVGAVAAVALTVPGLSGSLILLILGFYRPLVDSAKTWAKELFTGDFSHTLPLIGMIGCFGIGCLIGVVVVSKIMNILLNKWRHGTFYVIIGFIAGSILVLFFNFDIFNYYRVWSDQSLSYLLKIHQLLPMWLEIVIGVIVLAGAAFLSYLLVRAQRKHALEEKESNENEELPQ